LRAKVVMRLVKGRGRVGEAERAQPKKTGTAEASPADLKKIFCKTNTTVDFIYIPKFTV
jgi:hypothetical protein